MGRGALENHARADRLSLGALEPLEKLRFGAAGRSKMKTLKQKTDPKPLDHDTVYPRVPNVGDAPYERIIR